MRIYLDNCCFNRPFDEQSKIQIKLETEAKLYIQEKISKKEIELVWSYILEYENSENPYQERKDYIIKWKNKSVDDIQETKVIIDNANELLSQGIKTKDALHISCAIYGKCEYFLTTDYDLIKKSSNNKNIKVISPIHFIELIEEH